MRRLENHAFPEIGKTPVSQLDAPMILRTLRKIEKAGTPETAKRVGQFISQTLRYGVQNGRAGRDFMPDLKGALLPVEVSNRARVPLDELPNFLRDIAAADLYPVTKAAIDWLFLTACRSGEMRFAKWGEIDTAKASWTVPAARMKMKTAHIVPLSHQALKVLESLHALAITHAPDQFIFPSPQRSSQAMSENTIGYAFNRAGYHGRQTPHGIRGLFSTHCNESAKWQFNDIEMALAHQTGNAVSRAYNSAQRIPERAKLMQWWADEIDRMRDGARVIPMQRNA